MVKFVFFFLIVFLFASCQTELVKWEYTSKPTFSSSGSFVSNGLNIRKSITLDEIKKALNLKPSVEIQSVKITGSFLALNILDDPNLADSLSYVLTTDLIPTQQGTEPIKAQVIKENNYNPTIKLPIGSLDVVTIINTALKGLVATGAAVDFHLFALPKPSGKVIPGNVTLKIDFDVVYWECTEKPEITVFSNSNKGLCE
jgi:hypothetical protein